MADELVERDLRDHAKSIGAIVDRINKIENERNTENAVAVERRENLDDRLERLEASISQMYGLGKWILGTVGTLLLTAVVGLIFKGGILG